jgi:hypothetical protein
VATKKTATFWFDSLKRINQSEDANIGDNIKINTERIKVWTELMRFRIGARGRSLVKTETDFRFP